MKELCRMIRSPRILGIFRRRMKNTSTPITRRLAPKSGRAGCKNHPGADEIYTRPLLPTFYWGSNIWDGNMLSWHPGSSGPVSPWELMQNRMGPDNLPRWKLPPSFLLIFLHFSTCSHPPKPEVTYLIKSTRWWTLGKGRSLSVVLKLNPTHLSIRGKIRHDISPSICAKLCKLRPRHLASFSRPSSWA
jgi:hypothetical protein